MARLRIFLSYSHQDTPIQFTLVARLREGNFEVSWDTGQAHSSELHRHISANLNACDVVIPIITSNWLASHECRDEMVRANERRKLIIPFRQKDVSDDGPPKVPWYLRENLYLSVLWHVDELHRAVDDLIARLVHIQPDSWQAACYRDLRKIGDDVQQSSESTPGWKAALCQRVLSLAKAQLHNILVTDDCGFPLTHEQAYLRFAEPIFGQAKTIIAVSIASISTFWTNPAFSNAAGDYLKNQRSSADSICRLFVFDSVAEVMHFRSILEKHHEVYGKHTATSGVFLCSTASYQRLLEKWRLTVDDRDLQQDFGLLSFGEGSRRIYATLDQREFRYAAYEEEDPTYGANRIIIEDFAALTKLDLGTFDPDFGVARWSPEWSQRNEKLAECLARLFQDRPQSVTHVVLLKSNHNATGVEEYLQQLVSRFYKERKALKISSISVKRRCGDLSVTDGRYAAPLLLFQNFDHVLTMDFDDEPALKHYYQHGIHSLEREKLYVLLNPEIKCKFDDLSRLDQREVQERAALFSEIERVMVNRNFILRIDARSEDPLLEMISRFSC
jgi:hypothetical protein